MNWELNNPESTKLSLNIKFVMNTKVLKEIHHLIHEKLNQSTVGKIFLTPFTWWVKNTSTADLFHIVGNIEMITASQDSYSCPSRKVVDFAINNF